MTKAPSWDPFAELGIEGNATAEEVEKAFRNLAKRHHPDVSKEPDAAAKFARIKEARDLLMDGGRRGSFARSRPQSFRKVSDAFDDVFQAFGDIERERAGPMHGRRRSRGGDVVRQIGISLEQAFQGIRGRLGDAPAACEDCSGSGKVATDPHPCTYCHGVGSVRRSKGLITLDVECPNCEGSGRSTVTSCRSCGGSGQVQGKGAVFDIPAGVRDGMEILMRGRGAPGMGGGPPGDLTIAISVKPHPIFSRKDSELSTTIAIPVWEAAGGCSRALVGVDGKEIVVEIPAGTRGGTEILLEGEGMPNFPGRGVLRVRVDVDIPRADSPEMRDAFEAVRKASLTSKAASVSGR